MIKQLFALASVTALGGLVAAANTTGCSSSPSETTAAPVGDGGDRTTEKADANATEPAPGGGDAAAASSCKAKISYAAEEVKPSAPQATACTAEVVDALADACAKDPNAQECTDARNGPANKDCASCIFGSKTDDEWKVLNLMPGDTPAARYNQEGCVDHVTGVPGCGHAYVTVLGCFNDFCSKCPQNEARACVEEIAEGECKDFRITDQKCGGALTDKEVAVDGCFPASPDLAGVRGLFVYLSRVACGPPPEVKQGG